MRPLVTLLLWILILPFTLVPGASTAAAADTSGAEVREAREIRTVWTGEFGLPRPTGIAYLPSRRELLVAQGRGGSARVLRLGFAEEALGSFAFPGLSDIATLAVDPARGRLTGLSGGELIAAPIRALDADLPATTRRDVSGLGLEDAQGATFDPATGTWYVLDAATRSIVRVPTAGGTVGSAARIPLGALGSERLQGLAFNPLDGLLYVGSPGDGLIYAVDDAGAALETFRTASSELSDPRAMVFAPSSDTTDDPDTLHLFVADAGGDTTLGGVTELTLAAEVELMAVEEVPVTLVQVIDTSLFTPGSPDPSGITYLAGPDRLMIVDSEADEGTGAGYHGVNMWELTRSGAVTDTGTTLEYSPEPTGAGYDPGTNTLFISSDSGNRVFVLGQGPDARFGTPDDVVSFIDAASFGVADAEDPEFDVATGHLFFLDGVNTEVYRVDPVNGTFGDTDDVVSHFDVGAYGPTNVEALGSDQSSGTLLVGDRRTRKIYELTRTGELVRIIDASTVPGMTFLSGLTMAPASDGSGPMNIWTVDRAVDNGADPNENDGKIFELSLGPSDNSAPVITSVVIDQAEPRTNDTLTATVTAEDADGDPITYSFQWRKNGVALAGQTTPTLDLSLPGNGDKGDAISLRVIPSDGEALGAARTSPQVTIGNSGPTFARDLPDRTDREWQSVSFSAGADDDDGDTLSYEATGLPAGVGIDPATGLISGTIAVGAATGSPYAVEVTVRDGSEVDDTDTFVWTVTLRRVCRGTIGAVTVISVRVPQGATCTLNGTYVKGTVKVERGATLKAFGVRVVGNVQAENARYVVVREASRVGGSVQIVQGAAARILGSRVQGDLLFDDQRRALTANRNVIGGHLKVFENTGGVEIRRNRIGGSLKCRENRPAPVGGGNIVQGHKGYQCRRL